MTDETKTALLSQLRAPVADERDSVAVSQFLTDVMTAAGLVAHGKRCKALAERLGKACMDLRLSTALASAPVAGEAQPVAWLPDGCGPTKDPGIAQAWRNLGRNVRPLVYGDAAPQASEDARNAVLEEAVKACEDVTKGFRIPVPIPATRQAWKAVELCASAVRALKSTPAPQPAQPCATCGGTGMVDDGEITGSGGVEYECGPVKCVKDCPDCDTGPRKLREARAAALSAQPGAQRTGGSDAE